MGKFACTCGNSISDSISPNEVTGEILSDKGSDEFWITVENIIADFVAHHDAGTTKEWMKKHFNHHYPDTCTPGQMVGDAISNLFSRLILHMMECDRCGRLWIQKANGVNGYFAYSPDDLERQIKVLGLNRPQQAESGPRD